MIQINDRGLNTSQNVIDSLLDFNTSSTWTTIGVGIGNAVISNIDYFDGVSSLKINNTDYFTSDLVVSNSTQNTVIKKNGVFDFSLYLKKELAEDLTFNVEIFKNASSVYNEDFVINADKVNVWTSFITNENFAFIKDDVITFRFTLKANLSSSTKDVTVFLDGLHIYNKERNQLEAPIYSKSIYAPTNTTTGGVHYIDGTYTELSPLSITEGTTAQLTCDNNTIINNNMPTDFVNGMFDSVANKLLAVNEKDWFDLEIRFRAKNSENDGYFEIAIDIDGVVGELSGVTESFTRLSGTEERFKPSFQYYSGSVFISNGGKINITAVKGDLSIYNIEILPFRKHKGY